MGRWRGERCWAGGVLEQAGRRAGGVLEQGTWVVFLVVAVVWALLEALQAHPGKAAGWRIA